MASADAESVDATHMRRALDLALRGWGQTAPNPLVGAVLVGDAQVVGEGWHAKYGHEHAEVMALRSAGPRARGATLYVTLEPCAHTGQTPPCVEAIIAAGVARVVMPLRDPHPVARGGVERLQAAGIEVMVGVEAGAATELNAAFLFGLHGDRPWVTLKLAVSLDGAVADAARSRGWLTGEAARREVHRLRAGSDAIAVGIGTVLADDPLLTVRHDPVPRVPPLRVVFDRQARLPTESQLVRTAQAGPVLVIAREPHATSAARLVGAGVEILSVPQLAQALRLLHRRGVRSLLLEGGPRLAGAFLEEAAVDRVVIFQAPVVLGAGAEPAFAFAPSAKVSAAPRWPVVARRSFGDDLMTIYAVSAP